MRIKSKFVDADGERELNEVVAPSKEGSEMIEKVWVGGFRDMLMAALEEGDDVEIFVKRVPNNTRAYAA